MTVELEQLSLVINSTLFTRENNRQTFMFITAVLLLGWKNRLI
jgi:hypothetical protein